MLDHEDNSRSHTRVPVRLILALAILLALCLFAIANTQEVSVDLLADTQQVPLVMIMGISAVAGAMIAALARWRRHHH